jgi:hypothetical protein
MIAKASITRRMLELVPCDLLHDGRFAVGEDVKTLVLSSNKIVPKDLKHSLGQRLLVSEL